MKGHLYTCLMELILDMTRPNNKVMQWCSDIIKKLTRKKHLCARNSFFKRWDVKRWEPFRERKCLQRMGRALRKEVLCLYIHWCPAPRGFGKGTIGTHLKKGVGGTTYKLCIHIQIRVRHYPIYMLSPFLEDLHNTWPSIANVMMKHSCRWVLHVEVLHSRRSRKAANPCLFMVFHFAGVWCVLGLCPELWQTHLPAPSWSRAQPILFAISRDAVLTMGFSCRNSWACPALHPLWILRQFSECEVHFGSRWRDIDMDGMEPQTCLLCLCFFFLVDG